jgi:hypothetical protein
MEKIITAKVQLISWMIFLSEKDKKLIDLVNTIIERTAMFVLKRKLVL